MKIKGFIILLSFIALISSCNSYQKVLKKGSFDDKFKAGMDYYNKKDYYKAGLIFEAISAAALGKPQMEDIKFYYAYCQYHQQAFMMSQYYFKEFTETFPRSARTEEATFRAAESSYYQSPRYSLEQINSYRAIDDLQNFLLKYPFSKHKGQADAIIREMEGKIEYKAFVGAKQYLKIREYKAAVVVLENFRLDFPASNFKEEVMFLKIKAQYELAIISYERIEKDGEIIELKKDRLTDVKLYYHDFIDSYPASEFNKDAQRMYSSASAQLQMNKTKKK
jgi:outer membrane protein assembly factor BamD